MLMYLWFFEALIDGDWQKNVRLSINDGLISAIEIGTEHNDYDERHDIGLPGLGNVHSHTFQRAMAGLTETQTDPHDDFWSWRALMYQFLERLSPDDIEAIAALAFSQMLEAGFTHVGEFHYLHNDVSGNPYQRRTETTEAILKAARTTGIGLTLLPVYYAQGDFLGAPPHHGQRRFLHDLDGFHDLLAQTQKLIMPHEILGIAPHSLRAVTPDDLSILISIRDNLKITGPIHIHVAEQVREVEASVAALRARPVQWLMDSYNVDENWCLVHSTHLDNTEVNNLAKSGAVAGLCPITEANLGDGIFPAEAYLRSGGTFGIGTDSNIVIDAAGEFRSLEYSQRLSLRARGRLAGMGQISVGRTLFDGAIKGGARALQTTGGLKIGTPANIISLKSDHPALWERQGDQILDSWIFAASSNPIERVYSSGRLVVKDGAAIGFDTIKHNYRKVLTKIRA